MSHTYKAVNGYKAKAVVKSKRKLVKQLKQRRKAKHTYA